MRETLGGGIGVTSSYNLNIGMLETVQGGTGNAVSNQYYSFNSVGEITAWVDYTQSVTDSFGDDALSRLTAYGSTVNCNLPVPMTASEVVSNIAS